MAPTGSALTSGECVPSGSAVGPIRVKRSARRQDRPTSHCTPQCVASWGIAFSEEVDMLGRLRRLYAVALGGVNGFFDRRDTPASDYNQLGLGVELLGERWEARANGYKVIGRDATLLGAAGPFNVGTIGTNIIRAQAGVYEVALSGFDTEV